MSWTWQYETSDGGLVTTRSLPREVFGSQGDAETWLGERCGPTGHVLVTDIDPRFLVELAPLAHPTLEIQRHDIGSDPRRHSPLI